MEEDKRENIDMKELSPEQMRYQQKQMQEISQKKSEIFDDSQKLLTSSLGAGKVRNEFEVIDTEHLYQARVLGARYV